MRCGGKQMFWCGESILKMIAGKQNCKIYCKKGGLGELESVLKRKLRFCHNYVPTGLSQFNFLGEEYRWVLLEYRGQAIHIVFNQQPISYRKCCSIFNFQFCIFF